MREALTLQPFYAISDKISVEVTRNILVCFQPCHYFIESFRPRE